MKSLNLLIASAAIGILGGSALADPVTIGFDRIEPSNAPENVEAQFTVTISDFAAGVVDFTFMNAVGIASSISEIYFDDGTLLDIATLIQNGTSFTEGASPGDLPGGQNASPPFNVTAGFLVDAQGNPSLGIDTATDSLTIRFTLQGGQTFADTIAAINDGSLRIGMHVRAIGANGESDSFINSPPVVPLPPAAFAGLTTLAGLMGLSVLRRRSHRRS